MMLGKPKRHRINKRAKLAKLAQRLKERLAAKTALCQKAVNP